MSKVSIIMPNYNGSRFIEKAIRSIMTQTYQDWELVLMDDCSKDDSLEIANKLAGEDQRIKVNQNPQNSGTAKTRNNALRKASGDYIAFLDSDDWWEPEYLNEQIKLLKDSSADLVYCNYTMVDENGKFIKNINKYRAQLTYKDNLWSNHIGQLAGLFKRSAAPNVFYDESLGSIKDDYAFWLDVLKNCKYGVGNNKTLAHYRVFSGSITSGKHKLVAPHFKLLYKRQNLGLLKSSLYTANWALQGLYNFHLKK